jgi:hypothetical protein
MLIWSVGSSKHLFTVQFEILVMCNSKYGMGSGGYVVGACCVWRMLYYREHLHGAVKYFDLLRVSALLT